jgi:DNA polymerase-3 subunit alpha
MYIIFDTETTGLPKNYNAPVSDLENWPRMVQVAWQLHDAKGALLNAGNFIVKPEGYTIPYNSEKIHGISTERANKEGLDLSEVLDDFAQDVQKAEYLVGHNIEFDINIVGAEFLRKEKKNLLEGMKVLDTKEAGTDFCKIPGGRGGGYKWPTLTELHEKLFGAGFADAHDAAYDVDATAKSFFGLVKLRQIPELKDIPINDVEYESPDLDEANFAKQKKSKDSGLKVSEEAAKKIDSGFVHLHNHSQYSILQSTSRVDQIVNKAKEDGMTAVAITDMGNMFSAFSFVRDAHKAGIKPIVGCEFYVTEDRTIRQFTKDNPDKRYQVPMIAKNKAGYHNLAKLSSIGYVDGYYFGVPRIDKDVIAEYKDNIIAFSGGIYGEIPDLILNVGETQAEEALQWWLETFGDDFYLELIRHGLEEENRINEVLLRFADKYKIKYFAANDVFYLDQDDANAHDILLCIKDGELQSTPKGKGRGFRYGLQNEEYYFKSQDEMKAIFADLPKAIETTQEIADKVEPFELQRDVLLPKFEIPDEFKDSEDEKDGGKRGENAYLRHLTYEGAKSRYGEITDEIRERLDFELSIIEKTGYPGYFLIVQDFTGQARKMGVSVGPGRGSAAGSAVAYCIGITNVDPIKYDLLFERFLNPDRVSLPDIDIDFDDEGRNRIIDWVVKKYGQNQVAQIITYGTMAAKSSVRDTARVLNLPLAEADQVAKKVPDISLNKLFKLKKDELKEKLRGDQMMLADQLKQIAEGTDLAATTVNQARILEGSVRNTGTHACGVIITPDDITKYIPVSVAKDADLLVTQFDNAVVESAGMLKMDFLGLKTLTIIKEAIRLIKEKHGVDIDPDEIPLDDEKTYELYQKGLTNGTFQFESPGMQKHLKDLKPDKFQDLIAMNALYRPGPMEYIPNFVKRKHALEEISYDLPEMEEYLAETYGITVYQEQVMLLSQKLAGFTKGQADALRKGMGKKKKEIIDELKPKFLEGCEKNGHPVEIAEKIWKDWEAFAAYAFNKSHSTCYSVVAFHTAYLKAHYPAEYMAAVLTHNMNDIKKVTFFMDECKHLGIKVLGPDVNESGRFFNVNEEGQIRFGLGAIKGTGEAAVESIIEERDESGPFKDIFDLASRTDPRKVNKKTYEALAMAGAFDNFPEYHRRQYLEANEGDEALIEKAIKYGQRMAAEKNSSQASLFGGAGDAADMPKPRIEALEPYGEIEKLNIEKEVVGFYISGHPLDEFKVELEHICSHAIKDLPRMQTRELRIGGMVTGVRQGQTKKGTPFAVMTLEDMSGQVEIFRLGDDYLNVANYFKTGIFLFVKGKMGLRWSKKQELQRDPKTPVNPEDWEFQPHEFNLLSEVRDQQAKKIELYLQTAVIDESMVNEIEKTVSSNPGKCTLKMFIQDPLEKIEIEFLSRKFTVDPNDQLFSQLDKMDGVSYKLLI